MFLFIFESIGTSELILIGIIALVVFGPRKLPQFAKTIGKTMAEFRRTTNEFKSTWEKEVDFEEEIQLLKREENLIENPKPIEGKLDLNQNLIATPEIREIDQTQFNQSIEKSSQKEISEVRAENFEQKAKVEKSPQEETSKQNWL